MAKPDISKVFKRALNGQGPTGFLKFQESQPVAIHNPYSRTMAALDTFIEEVEDASATYASVVYYRDEADDYAPGDRESLDDITHEAAESLLSAANAGVEDMAGENVFSDGGSDDLELDTHRAVFFNHLQRAAALLNCSMQDICAASDNDYQELWDDYVADCDFQDDMIYIAISSHIYEELNAFKEMRLQGSRQHDTAISRYLAAKPVRDYTLDL